MVTKHTAAIASCFATLLFVCWFVYQPAISGPFMLDDFDNLGALKGGVFDEVSLKNYLETGNAGPLGRPIAKISFLLNDNAWPSTPESFKRTNLFIHLLVAIFVFAVFRLLMRQLVSTKHADWFAVFVAGIFLFHPIQVSTTMYVVQRMTQLSSLFVMMGIFFHLLLRQRFPSPTVHHLALFTLNIALFSTLAAFSKESGVLLPVFLLVLELTIFSNQLCSPSWKVWRTLFLVAPTVLLICYLAYWPRWLGSYDHRDFTMMERLITQPVVLMDYAGSILDMRVYKLGLFHDDYPIFSSLLEWQAAFSLAFIICAIVLAIKIRRRYSLISFGVLWFFSAHLLESTSVALEIYFEHRNYLAMIGIWLVVLQIFYSVILRVTDNKTLIMSVFSVCVLSLASFTTFGYATEWGDKGRILPIWSAEHPGSARAQRTYAQYLASIGLPHGALDTLDYAYQKFPMDLSIPVMSIDISCTFGLPMRFSFSELSHEVSEHKLTDGLRPALTSLTQHFPGSSCAELSEELHDFINQLQHLGKIEKSISALAAFFVLDGKLYIQERNGNGARKAFENVDILKPSPDSALRLAGLFIQVGDFDRAKAMLRVAKERQEGSKKGLSKYQANLYEEKFNMIDYLQNKSLDEKDSL